MFLIREKVFNMRKGISEYDDDDEGVGRMLPGFVCFLSVLPFYLTIPRRKSMIEEERRR